METPDFVVKLEVLELRAGCPQTCYNGISIILHFDFVFAFGHAACGILVSQPGTEPAPSPVKALSLNHWTAREVPIMIILNSSCLSRSQCRRKLWPPLCPRKQEINPSWKRPTPHLGR